MKFRKALSVLLAGWASLAQPVAAEEFPLWSGGFWNVSAVDTELEGFYCKLSNTHKGEGQLTLMVDPDGVYTLLLYAINGTHSNVSTVTVNIEMRSPGRQSTQWSLNGARSKYFPEKGLYIVEFVFGQDPAQRGFVADFMAYHKLDVIDREGKGLLNFSLRGSADGVRELDKCRRYIKATPL